MSVSTRVILTIFVLSASRVLGVARELGIAVAFGFSRATDFFYQSVFPFNVVSTLANGPYTTSLTAAIGGLSAEEKRSAVQSFVPRIWRFAAPLLVICAGYSVILSVNSELSAPDIALALLSISVAVPCVLLSGFGYAALCALGSMPEAAKSFFISNSSFLIAIAFSWTLGPEPHPVWMLVASYTASAVITAAYLVRALKSRGVNTFQFFGKPSAAPVRATAFWWATCETGGYLATQAAVLALATASGAGWASGAALAQRIATSINGLIISPVATSFMLTLMEHSGEARGRLASRYLLITTAALLAIGLTVAALFIGPLREMGGFLPPKASGLLSALIPAFALWMIPLGLNIFLCRAMFAIGAGRSYVMVMVAVYAAANIGRFIAWDSFNFAVAIYVGAFFELVGAMIVGVQLQCRLRESVK